MSYAGVSKSGRTGNEQFISGPEDFVTTNWSMVLQARQENGKASDYLAELCRVYWFPLYAYARQRVYSFHDAEDLVQEFFGWLLTHDIVKRADRDRGRFRTFLQVAFRQFCAREHRKAHAQKRSPSNPILSIHFADAERRFERAMVHQLSADRLFDHSWAITVLELTMNRLRREYEKTGRAERFEAIAPFLTDDRRSGRQEAVSALRMTDSAFAMALVRLRQRFGKLLREEIERTVSHPDDIEDELMRIWAALSTS
ncbi:sigma-70 family RNA polymerase sigma factor [bacterium]|nr:sigma-70 family RNA polymerase sigma factor [bacterium]